MPHNEDVLLPTLVSDTLAIAPSQLRKLDQLASESINGDEGSEHSPTSQISIGGDGVEFDNTGYIHGGVTSKGHNETPSILFKAGHWPSHSPVKTGRVVFPIRPRLSNQFENFFSNNYNVGPGFLQFVNGGNPQLMMVPLPLNNFPIGAKISSIELNFKVGVNNSVLPSDTIYFALLTKPANKNVAYPSTRIEPWQSSHPYSTGSMIVSNTFAADNYSTPYAYEKTNPGTQTSSLFEPAGLAAGASAVSDNGITWTRRSLKDTSNIINLFTKRFPLPATAEQYFNGGKVNTITISNVNVFPTINNFDHILYIRDRTTTKNRFLSLVVNFANISEIRNIL